MGKETFNGVLQAILLEKTDWRRFDAAKCNTPSDLELSRGNGQLSDPTVFLGLYRLYTLALWPSNQKMCAKRAVA